MRAIDFMDFPDQGDWHIGETHFCKRQNRHRARPSRSRTTLPGPPRCRRKQTPNTLHHLGDTLLVFRELLLFNQIFHAGRVISLHQPTSQWVERSITIDAKPIANLGQIHARQPNWQFLLRRGIGMNLVLFQSSWDFDGINLLRQAMPKKDKQLKIKEL